MTFPLTVVAANIANATQTRRRRSTGLIRGVLVGVLGVGLFWFFLVLCGVE